MTPFIEIRGKAVPLMMADIDTDQMITREFLITKSRKGLGRGLFHHWRFVDGKRVEDFPFNWDWAADPQILIAGPNFACGSSREHAVWSVMDYGFKAVIAPSFGVHFRRNAYKNGLLPVILAANEVEHLAEAVTRSRGKQLIHVSLPQQTVTLDDGPSYRFEIEEEPKAALLEGLDEIGLTLRHAAAIGAFQEKDAPRRPWVYLRNEY